MRRIYATIVMLGFSLAGGSDGMAQEPRASSQVLSWGPLAPLPDKEGFAYPFAGVSEGQLLVAGGANFPDKRPWEGGTKVWYDTVFALHTPKGQWRMVGKLPRPIGYGVSLTTNKGIVCAGGSNAEGHFKDVYLMRLGAKRIETSLLPPLPKACANSCGVLIGDVVYIAGGIEKPDATAAMKNFWSLDLSKLQDGWQELEPWPGPARMLATAGALGGSFYLFSGAALSPGADGKPEREWLKDAYRYTPGAGWKRVADLPNVAVASPTPATLLNVEYLMVMGGDDGKQLLASPQDHKGFPRHSQIYSAKSDSWVVSPDLPFSLVTTPAVPWNGATIVPGGEKQPGIRSTEVWSLEINGASK